MTESRSKTLEVMALASCSKVGDSPPCRVACSGCKRHMEAALTAYESHLQAEGMAVVPVEPSGDVITAGCLALGGAAAREALMAAMLSGDRHAVAHTKMRIRWHAMLAAAP